MGTYGTNIKLINQSLNVVIVAVSEPAVI